MRSAIYERVRPAVVEITSTQQSRSAFGTPSVGTGTGIVIDDKGIILTNNHVVAGAADIEVKFDDGSTASAVVLGTDPDDDLAVIQVGTRLLSVGSCGRRSGGSGTSGPDGPKSTVPTLSDPTCCRASASARPVGALSGPTPRDMGATTITVAHCGVVASSARTGPLAAGQSLRKANSPACSSASTCRLHGASASSSW